MRKATALVIGMIAISSVAYGQCVKGDCQDGYGIYEYGNGSVYEGNFVDGLRAGWGCYLYDSGDVNCGNWIAGDKHYLNHYFWATNGDFFIGNFIKNERQRSGVYVHYNGSADYRHDRFYHSKPFEGTGCVYGGCGYYSWATLNDRVIIYNPSNSTHWRQYSKMSGDEWGNEYRTGWTCYSFGENDTVRCGHNSLDDWHLAGGYFWNEPGDSRNDFFLGLYKDNERQEHGLYSFDSSSNEDFLVKRTYLDVDKYMDMGSGCVKGDCYDGLGIWVYDNGYYEGRFMDGLRQGWGCYVFKEGDFVKCGNWKEGKSHYLTYSFWNNSPSEGGADFFIGMYKEGERQPWGIYVYEDGKVDYRNTVVRF